jgi:hypothetical protein
MDLFKPRLETFSVTSQKTLLKYGDNEIKHIIIRRKPIPKFMESFLRLIQTGGKIEYDRFYHLSIICNFETGNNVIIEKNEEVHINDNYTQSPAEAEYIKVDLRGKTPTLLEFIYTAYKKMGARNFFFYESMSLNCQRFVKDLLLYNNLLTPSLEKFIMQDMKNLIKNTPPFMRKLAEYVTTTANVVNKISGNGKDKNDENNEDDEDDEKDEKVIYCGIEPLKDTQRYGNMSECAKLNQLRRFGKYKVDNKLLEQKIATKTEREKISKNVSSYWKYLKKMDENDNLNDEIKRLSIKVKKTKNEDFINQLNKTINKYSKKINRNLKVINLPKIEALEKTERTPLIAKMELQIPKLKTDKYKKIFIDVIKKLNNKKGK